MCKPSTSTQTIDVWEISPHYKPEYDCLLTDDGTQVEALVQMVAESWLDAGTQHGDELTITIKVREMSRYEYEELTAPETT